MTCIVVSHQAVTTADGHVAAIRMASIIKPAEATVTSKVCVILTPRQARQMANAMRDDYGRFFKEDGGQSVEVWCQVYEGFEITWKRADGAEVCEAINCCKSGGDGWSWEFSQALEDAASEAEGGQ